MFLEDQVSQHMLILILFYEEFLERTSWKLKVEVSTPIYMLSVAFIVGERKGKVGFSGLVQWLEVLISLLFLGRQEGLRDDGVEGQPVSASTDPIAVEPDVLKEVKQKLDLGSVKFEVLFDKDRSPKKIPGMGSLERRILEVNRKRIKVVKPGSKTSFPAIEIHGSYAPPFHVELLRNDQHIVIDGENEVDLMLQTRHLHDVIVLVIRGFAQRFNSTALNTLLKIDM